MNRTFGLWLRWVGVNALTEGIGLGGSLLLGVLMFPQFEAAQTAAAILAVAVIAVLLGTFLEGVLVGAGQWLVLRRPLPAMRWQAWVLATAAGAGVAWILGMTPATILSLIDLGSPAVPAAAGAAPAFEISDALQYGLAAAMGLLVLGPLLGFAQWFALRHHVRRAGWWVPANAAAWALGMPLVFVGMGLLPPDASPLLAGAIALATTIITGAVVGAVHGIVLLALLRGSDPPDPAA